MQARIHFLVKDLLCELESEQIHLGTGIQLRMQELLRRLPDDISDADLMLALAPVLALSGREQDLVYEKFALCQRRADEVFGQQITYDPDERRPIDALSQKIKNSKHRFWAIAVLLAAVLTGLIWKFYAIEKTPIVKKSFTVNAGQISSICPTNMPELDSLGGKIARFAVKFIQNVTTITARTMPAGSIWVGSSTLADYYVQNDSCLLVAARDSVRAMDSLVLNIIFQNQKNCELHLRIFIDPKIETPQKTSSDTLFRALVIWLNNNWLWLRWAIFISFCILLFAFWRWFEWNQRKLYAQLDRKDKPPYIWNVEIPGVEKVVLDDAYRHVLQVMRRRIQSSTQRLDMELTIAATVERGGLPKFQYRPVSQPVDYLVLLDRQQTGNHRTQLFDTFYRAFKAQELAIERFFYDSDLLVCFNEVYPQGIRLGELAHRFAKARLVLVGSGLQLIHSLRSSLVAWVDLFEHWPQRLLLTPRHPNEWTRNERILGTIFQVLPATLQSLRFWIEELEQGEDANFDRWQEQVKDVPEVVFQPDEVYPLASLLLQFPSELVRWVAACAIYPSLHWDLTLWLGQELETHNDATLFKHDTLLRLFSICWFVDGQMPQTAREQLLQWLDGEDSALVSALRRSLAAVLAQSPPPEDSLAWADHRLQLVFNRWMSESNRKIRKKHEKELSRLVPQADVDFVVLKYLDVPPTPLHFAVPLALKKYVYREYWQRFYIFNQTKKHDLIQKKDVMEPTLYPKENSIHPAPLKTFIIYSRKDEAFKNELLMLLRDSLIKSGHLSIWHDGDILSGEKWEKKIQQKLDESDIFLLLLSADSANSEYIQKEELSRALTKNGWIVPIIVRPYDWKSDSLFGSLQVLPKNMRPVSSFNNHDDAWTEVIASLKKMVEHIWDKQQKVIQLDNQKHANVFAEMVFVKGGTFQMGSNDEDNQKPVHPVTLDDFFISKYPVTQRQWNEIMGNNPSKFKNNEHLPIECVSWYEAQKFVQKLNEKHPGCNYRLPSEAEWEYAARGGEQTKGHQYAGSNNLSKVAWYSSNSDGETHLVGGKKANELGIFDMSGNVYEWCRDVWHDNYRGAPSNGSAWTSGGDQSRRVLRGGSWGSNDKYCSLTYRSRLGPTSWLSNIGFRLARHP